MFQLLFVLEIPLSYQRKKRGVIEKHANKNYQLSTQNNKDLNNIKTNF